MIQVSKNWLIDGGSGDRSPDKKFSTHNHNI